MAPKRPPTNAGDSSATAAAGDSGRVTRSSTRLATAVTPPAEDPAAPNKKKAKTTTTSAAAAVAPPAEDPTSPKKKKAKTTTTSSAAAPPAEDPAAQKKRKTKTTTATTSSSAAAEKPQPPTSDPGGSKKIIIEHCKQCNAFKTRAIQVKTALEEGIPGIEVSLNPEKPRRGCFEIREEGGEVFISLLDMKRPFPPLKKLDMEEVISDILEKIR
ncbi:hypothetical protein ABFX02_01G077900 [Erythranthe guttata]